ADAVALASETYPHVVMADYQLSDWTGAELATRLHKVEPAIRVLLLSAVVSNPLLQEAVKAGAQGFLLKTQPAEELVHAVRRAAAGEMLIPAVRLAAMLTGSDQHAQLFDLLTGREREVLRLLAAGLDNRHIAARMGIGYVTVRSHLRNLSSKLDAHSKGEILARAAGLGLIVREAVALYADPTGTTSSRRTATHASGRATLETIHQRRRRSMIKRLAIFGLPMALAIFLGACGPNMNPGTGGGSDPTPSVTAIHVASSGALGTYLTA